MALVFVFDDVAGKVENRLAQKPPFDEHEDVEDPSCAPVAVRERADCLKLAVGNRHRGQWVELVSDVNDLLPIPELAGDEIFALGGVYRRSKVVEFPMKVPGRDLSSML